MANKFDEMIETIKAANGGEEDEIIRAMMAKRDELGDDPSDEEVEAALKECIAAHLSQLMADKKDELSDEDKEFMENATAKVKELFAQENWIYHERVNRPGFVEYELGFGGRNCNLRMRVSIENKAKVCRIDCILPTPGDKLYSYIICEKIVRENYPRRYGAMHYDERDGEISYRYSYPITHGVYLDDLKRAFLAVAASADESYKVIKNTCVGKFKAKEINEILDNCNKLVSDLIDDDED